MVKHAKRVKRANVNDVPAVPIGYHLQIVPMLERYFSLTAPTCAP
jgi:hypothetical protein